MPPTRAHADDVEARVWAFEAACAGGARPDLAAFLPPPDAPHYRAVLCELACVELERAADRGEALTADHYLARFPVLAADPDARAALTRQEARTAGTAVVGARGDGPRDWRARAAELYARHAAGADGSDPTDAGFGGPPDSFPAPGTIILGFRLVRELGRGAFSRVFLAEQTELAGRPVVLKLGPALFAESNTLAQLQHTNIVPVYSAHRAGDTQALCMPYLGATTLTHVLDEYRRGTRKNPLLTTLAARAGSTMPAAGAPAEAPSGRHAVPPADPAHPAPPALDALRAMSHARAALWIAEQLADGLAHAHERGVLHRDIKPANVLIADDGTPLLLDFNLATDGRAGAAPPVLGGTLPYMAPEHLEALRGGTRPVDARSDVYALGVVLYELLTGRHPFPIHKGPLREQVPQMVADRVAGAPAAGGRSGAGAILAKCLNPDPARRYPSARALREDLHEELHDRPLRHAREPLGPARARKFVRRNRRGLARAAGAALVLAVVALGALWVAETNRAARATARAERARSAEHARDAEVLLALPTAADAAEGERACRAALAPFGLPERTDWDRAPAFAHLPAADRAEVRAEVPRTLLLLARALRVRALCAPDPTARAALLDEALRANARATEIGGDPIRRAALAQRALLSHTLGHADEAGRLLAAARALPPGDDWLEVADRIARGETDAADRALDGAARAAPSSAALWATRGAVATARGRHADAAAHYSTVLALRPQLWRARVWRAAALAEVGDHARARADLDAALARAPDDVHALVLRGITRVHLKDPAGAEGDLTRAIELGAPATRVYFARARARLARGDTAGAAADRAEGLKRQPADELSWIARGVARQATDPNGALADFEAALELNPLSCVAAQNKAAVLSEFLGKPGAAVEVLDRLLERCPEFVEARIGRAVLLARLGKRAAAHADVTAALALDRSGPTLYRAGCAHALTARADPGDRAAAFRYVTAALLAGYGAGYVPTDDDLAALKVDRAEFARLLALARDTGPKK